MKKILLDDLWRLRMKFSQELREEADRVGIDNFTLKKADRVTDSFVRWIFAELGE